jgi:adenylate cyclase
MRKHRSPDTTITSFFQEQFRLENLQSEQKRAAILSGLFVIGFVASIFFALFAPESELIPPRTLSILIGFMGFLAVYEFALWNGMRFMFSRKKRGLPEVTKFGNATAEISFISLALYTISRDYSPPIVTLLTPLTWIYFYFIILSTLRLNFYLSVYTSLVAAVEFFWLSRVFLHRGGDSDIHQMLATQFTYFIKSLVIFFSGVAAGYVAMLIQKSIKRSIETLEHQNQIINLFGQQISREVVNEMLKQNGSLQSSLREVTVMFIDIRGFTSYAEKRTPQEVVAYQNAFFGIIIEVVNRFQGIVNQFLGDGCMVTFGAPMALKNSCENAVRAGLAIIEQMEEKMSAGILPPTRVGIGLHVGEAVTGNIGTDVRQQYSITGNVVILASRIEQLNKEYGSQMLVSADVMRCIQQDDYALAGHPIGPVHVKGREEEIFLYQLA